MSDRQTFVVGTLITVGVFVLACGVGMTNVAVGGLGVALAVLGPLLILMTGLRGREFVYGTAHVHQVSPIPASGSVGRCELQLLVNARGINGVPVHTRDPSVPTTKWPDVGATLPVLVSIRDPRQVRILWDEVRTHRELENELYPQYRPPAPDFDPVNDDPVGYDPMSDPVPYERVEYSPTPPREATHYAGHYAGFAEDAPTLQDVPPVPAPRRPSPVPRTPVAAVSLAQPAVDTDHVDTDHVDDAGADAGADAGDGGDGGDGDDGQSSNGVSVTLIVSDLARSRAFYRDVLGLTELDVGRASAVLAFSDARVVLREVADMPPIDRRVAHLNLDVPDVQEAYDRLRAQGVEFVHRPRVVQQGDHLELCSATFRDPDGHAIALTRWMVRR